VATASFLVDPARQGCGVGRALGEYVLDWCRQTGLASIQFNAVVASNAPAVHLWQPPTASAITPVTPVRRARTGESSFI
jgi:GNAT superfamily N-acetyltransferase